MSHDVFRLKNMNVQKQETNEETQAEMKNYAHTEKWW